MGELPVDTVTEGAAIKRGGVVFFGKGRCSTCHIGPNLSDERFHNIGSSTGDLGRWDVTRNPKDKGAFKTPTLRSIVETRPYFHDGSKRTLFEVVEHYNRGGNPLDPNQDKELRRLNLSPRERSDLITFLRNL